MVGKKEISDNELLYQIRQGDEKAYQILLQRYEEYTYPMAISFLKRNRVKENDDVLQMCRIGINSAINSYKEDSNAGFKHYAFICAEMEIRSYFRTERRKGLYLNNNVYSLDTQISEGSNKYMVDNISNNIPEYNPSWYLESNELKELAQKEFKKLDSRQKAVYDLWLNDITYKEIANTLGLTVKQVDRTIQVVRKRIRKIIDSQN